MTTIKKYIQLTIAFSLGALITYLAMSLQIAKEELKAKSSQTEPVTSPYPPQLETKQKEEKYWLDERLEKQSAETQERIKQQQSKGDELKSKFDQFAE